MLTYLLGQSDYEVVTVSSMSEALSIIRREKFDLYVLDKRLPDGSGLDLCRRLNEATPEVPIVFYSGDAYQLHRQQGLEAGAAAYVTKPAVNELVDKVHQMLANAECSTAVA